MNTPTEPPNDPWKPDDGYKIAKALSDDQQGRLKASLHNWQVIAYVAMLVALVAVSGAIWLGQLPKRSIVIVYIDRLGNTVTYGGIVHGSRVTDDDWNRIKHMAFYNFITSWRTVTTDRQYQNRLWDNSYLFLGNNSAAWHHVRQWYTEHRPDARSSKETVSVDFISDGPVTDNTYEVQWREQTHTLMGAEDHTAEWHGVFTYMFTQPKDTDTKELELNPFGLLITEDSVSPVNPSASAEVH
jgi:type IV secretory pathway TrbF-like protein